VTKGVVVRHEQGVIIWGTGGFDWHAVHGTGKL